MSANPVHLSIRVRDDVVENANGPVVEVVDVAGNVVGDLTWAIVDDGVKWKGGRPSILTLELACERTSVDSLELFPAAKPALSSGGQAVAT